MTTAQRAWLSFAGGLAIQLLVTSLPGRLVPIHVGHPWDWVIHASMYAGLAFLAVRAVTLSRWSRLPLVWMGVAFSVYGALDELHQLLISGRSGSVSDWAFDTAGIAAGLLIGSWLMTSKAVKWLR